MPIRWISAAIALLATALVVAAAIAVGAILLPVLMKLSLGVRPVMSGAWVALTIGIATALILATRRSRDR